MQLWIRLSMLGYLLAYRVIFPTVAALGDSGAQELLAARATAELLLTLLLAFPFLFPKREYGWLHPLVLPVVLSVGKTLAKNPFSLFFPFDAPLNDFSVATASGAVTLALPHIDLAWLRLQHTLILALAQLSYLLAFFMAPKFRIPHIKLYKPRQMRAVSIAFIGALVLIVGYFIAGQGGISALLVAMRGGRAELLSGQGQFLFAATAVSFLVAAWFMYERKPWKNPIFIAALVLSVVLGIITTGSRSGAVMAILTIVLLWWKRRGRALILPMLAAAFVGILIVGGFGAIRQDYSSSSVDVSAFDPANYMSTVSQALEEIGDRSATESNLAVVAGVKADGLLWGKTYLYGAGFWVPRFLWPDKPRSADAYNFMYNFRGYSRNVEFEDVHFYGMPVNGEMEAFWNFSYPGVILIFGFMGLIHNIMARAAYVYRGVPFFWVIYIFVIANFSGASKGFVDLARTLVMLLIFAFAARILRLRGPSS